MIHILVAALLSAPLMHQDKSFVNEEAAIRRDDRLLLVRGDGRVLRELAKGVSEFEWSPDGNRMAYRQGKSMFVLDMRTLKPRRLPATVPPFNPHFAGDADGSVRFSFDPLLNVLVAGGVGDDLIRFSLNDKDWGNSTRFLTQRNHVEHAVAWSPDGKTLAFTRDGDLWVAHRNGLLEGQYYDEANRLAALAIWNDAEIGASLVTPFWVDELRWSPEGNKIVFHFQRQGGSGVSDVGWLELKKINRDRLEDLGGFKVTVRWLKNPDQMLLFSPDVVPSTGVLTVVGLRDRERALYQTDWKGSRWIKLIDNVDAVRWRPRP